MSKNTTSTKTNKNFFIKSDFVNNDTKKTSTNRLLLKNEGKKLEKSTVRFIFFKIIIS